MNISKGWQIWSTGTLGGDAVDHLVDGLGCVPAASTVDELAVRRHPFLSSHYWDNRRVVTTRDGQVEGSVASHNEARRRRCLPSGGAVCNGTRWRKTPHKPEGQQLLKE
ncbi:hypothetical protein GWK47_015604 [Chionoecetes opilio]|uniref:Uncharacterized protein n=1 Tax=Chionoecetes opilio TaxID=41210 RepID=A0A8J4XX66_CHIOP|nr:hypothetical protein GWK47_015604 [Chionoecetes opilio]